MIVIATLFLVAGCGASRTERLSVEVSSGAEGIRAFPAMWIGHYEGTGEIYTRSDDSWHDDRIARVSIARMARGKSGRFMLAGVIKQSRSETHAPGFSIEDLDLTSTTELVGESVHNVGGAYWRYEYEIRWVGDILQGEVSEFQSRFGSPQTVWRFSVRDMQRPVNDPLP